MSKNTPVLPSISRQCGACKHGEMTLVTANVGLYEEEQTFECEQCGARIQLPSAGSIGLYLWTWIMISSFVFWLFIWEDPYAGWVVHTVVGVGIGIGGFVGISNLVLHIRNPLVPLKTECQSKTAPPKLPSKIFNLGFFKTPIIVALAIVVFLGAAALIGYVKDYVL